MDRAALATSVVSVRLFAEAAAAVENGMAIAIREGGAAKNELGFSSFPGAWN